jgi:hypothetical protein
MLAVGQKQPVLKPQDLVVALKLSIAGGDSFTYAGLAAQLFMSPSQVHASVGRAYASRLIGRIDDGIAANNSSLREFILCGVKYAFPLVLGPVTRGIPTGISADPLRQHFDQSDALPYVWPDTEGHVRGIAVCPLCPSVPQASKHDARLHELLSLVDAIRGGAARERELAEAVLGEYIK